MAAFPGLPENFYNFFSSGYVWPDQDVSWKIRTVSIIQGRRNFAAVLGFFEAVVYICAVAKVLLNMNQPVYAVAYGLGFAAGTYLGIVIEQRLAFGKQLVFFLTPKAPSWSKSCAPETITWLKSRDIPETVI